MMRYKDLAFQAAWDCVDNYLTKIVQYWDYGGCSIEDMETQIEETLATGLFSIDEFGNWYDEEGVRI